MLHARLQDINLINFYYLFFHIIIHFEILKPKIRKKIPYLAIIFLSFLTLVSQSRGTFYKLCIALSDSKYYFVFVYSKIYCSFINLHLNIIIERTQQIK
jgi:hypothetical protein